MKSKVYKKYIFLLFFVSFANRIALFSMKSDFFCSINGLEKEIKNQGLTLMKDGFHFSLFSNGAISYSFKIKSEKYWVCPPRDKIDFLTVILI